MPNPNLGQRKSRLSSVSRQSSSSKLKTSDLIGEGHMRQEDVKALHDRIRNEHDYHQWWDPQAGTITRARWRWMPQPTMATSMTATYKAVHGGRLRMTKETESTSFGVPNFSRLCGCSRVQSHQAPKGHGGVQGFQAARVPQDIMGLLKLNYYMLQRGVRENTSMCNGPMQVFPAGRHYRRQMGAVH